MQSYPLDVLSLQLAGKPALEDEAVEAQPEEGHDPDQLLSLSDLQKDGLDAEANEAQYAALFDPESVKAEEAIRWKEVNTAQQATTGV